MVGGFKIKEKQKKKEECKDRDQRTEKASQEIKNWTRKKKEKVVIIDQHNISISEGELKKTTII